MAVISRWPLLFSVVSILSQLAVPRADAGLIYTPVDFSSQYNARMQTLQPPAAAIPEGSVVLGAFHSRPAWAATTSGGARWRFEELQDSLIFP